MVVGGSLLSYFPPMQPHSKKVLAINVSQTGSFLLRGLLQDPTPTHHVSDLVVSHFFDFVYFSLNSLRLGSVPLYSILHFFLLV